MTTVPTRYWHALEDGRIQCDVCPRACRLRDGQRGLCYVRAREGDGIVLTTYGRSSGFCVDPIEKKPLNHFLPGTPVLSFGTAGCNLACRFCQNWDISKSRDVDTLADAASPETIADAAAELGCASVAFTYNDPVIFLEYAIDVADACRERGIKAVAVTAGYICPEPRVEFYEHMDAANVDLKAFTERFYAGTCAAHLEPVLETLEYLKHGTEVWLEITNLLIPGLNDSNGEIDQMTSWVVERLGPDVPMHFTAFHPDYKMLDRPPTPPATLSRARAIALANGVRYAYTGNVHDREGGSTYCPVCGRCVVERDWYRIGSYDLTDDGHCRIAAPRSRASSRAHTGIGARAVSQSGSCRSQAELNRWPGSAEELVEQQAALGGERPLSWEPEPGLVAGACFVCFERGPSRPGRAGDRAWAAAACADAIAVITGSAGAAYEAGLLALREGPLLEAAVRALPQPPGVLLVDATGRDHPRRAGLALHLGAILDVPTVGVTHRTLLATGEWPADARGAASPLHVDGEVVGHWVRTRGGRRPLAVHAAWRTGPETAVEVVLACTHDLRTPEPLRRARTAARVARAGRPTEP